jgi:hypothetical protein
MLCAATNHRPVLKGFETSGRRAGTESGESYQPSPRSEGECCRIGGVVAPAPLGGIFLHGRSAMWGPTWGMFGTPRRVLLEYRSFGAVLSCDSRRLGSGSPPNRADWHRFEGIWPGDVRVGGLRVPPPQGRAAADSATRGGCAWRTPGRPGTARPPARGSAPVDSLGSG